MMSDRNLSNDRTLWSQAQDTKGAMLSTVKTLLWVQVICIAIAILIAMFIVADNKRLRSTVALAIREENHLKLQAAKSQIENYIEEIRICLEIISIDSNVKSLSRLSKDFIQAIYEADYVRNLVSEIYIIERDFDGTRRPFMSLEHGDDTHDQQELHSFEREVEEYSVQIEQLQRYIASPDLEFQISGEVSLCVGEPGLVLSSPIRSKTNLVGLVAGMIPSRTISTILEESSLENMVHLASTNGNVFTCEDFDELAASRIDTLLAREGVSDFFDSRKNGFQVEGYTALCTHVDIPGEARWFMSLIYDEAAALDASGVTSAWASWGAAGVVLLLGGVVLILCQVMKGLIMSRHQSESRRLALTESRALTLAAVDGIITIDDRGIIESMNAACGRIFGYAQNQVVGCNIKMLMPSPEREEHDKYILDYLRTGRRKIMGMIREIVGCRKDGTCFPIEVAVSEVRLPGKRLFTAIVRDITERKQAQQERLESENRLMAILDNTTRLIYLTDLEGRIILINFQFEHVFDVTRDEVIGKMTDDIIPYELPEQVHEKMERVINEKIPMEFEQLIQLHDGVHTFSTIKFPLLNTDGDIYAVCDIAADITQRKRAEKLAKQKQDELAHVTRLTTLGEMAAGLAHELNQPLTALVTYLQACRERIRGDRIDTSKLMEDIDYAIKQSHQAGDIIHHIRQFMRKSKVQRERININVLVRESMDLLEYLTSKGRIDLRLELAEDIPLMLVERVQIQQVILNLMKNAIDAMADTDEGKRRLIVNTSFNTSGELELAITDQGVGISGDAMERIFDPYYSTKPDGMGLGLSISQSIIEKHDGRLSVESSEDGGTIFRLMLPLDGGGLVV